MNDMSIHNVKVKIWHPIMNLPMYRYEYDLNSWIYESSVPVLTIAR